MSNEYRPFGIGIIGCGLIGQKRAKALGSGGQLVACADINMIIIEKERNISAS